MSITTHRISGFTIKRIDENNISLEVNFPAHISINGATRNILILTDSEFDVLMETIIAFTDSEAERPPVHFVGTA